MKFRTRHAGKITATIIIIISILFIKIFAMSSARIENSYSAIFYQRWAYFLRLLSGWIPFSLGDIFYLAAVLWLLVKIASSTKRLFQRKWRKQQLLQNLLKIIVIASVIYIVFNIFWGLNYNRKGIDYQVGISSKKYNSSDLKTMQGLLLIKLNESKIALINQHADYPNKKELFTRAINCYEQSRKQYPFLACKPSSVKSSLYGWMGNYLGFTGYYNPFTGEAQVNTTVPKFISPYTTTHEIAHQLGYAKEDEANFVGYLAATTSTDTLFHYSAYLDLFLYANSQVYFIDSIAAKQAVAGLLPEVKKDIKEWREFLKSHRSPFETVITWMYGQYLMANQQPKGMTTYVEVIADLIAFYKKFGRI